MRFRRPRPLSTRPRVSVVIPCYRYGHYLPDAVAGALDQSGVDVEVIIVDDASPGRQRRRGPRPGRDRPASAGARCTRRTPGTSRPTTTVWPVATGDYVTLVSADDLLTRDALTRAVALMEHHPRVGLVYGYARSFTGEPRAGRSGGSGTWSVYPGRQWLGLAARRGPLLPRAARRR